MVNESQKRDPRMWERWKKSGAIGTGAEGPERREQAAKAWFERAFQIEDTRIAEVERQGFLQTMKVRNAKYRAQEDVDASAERWRKNLQALRDRPNLSLEQSQSEGRDEAYGNSNNVLVFFRSSPWDERIDIAPRMIDSLQQITDLDDLSTKSAYLYWMVKEGLLRRAVESIGFRATQEALEKEHEYVIHGRQLRDKIGESWIGQHPIDPKDLGRYGLSRDEIEQMTADYYKVQNWYRQIYVALHDVGVNQFVLFGTREY